MFKKFKPTVDKLQGDIAEVGVYRGGSARQLAEAFPNKTIHLFDTFSGMPKSDPSIDSHKEGDFGNTSLARVQEKLKEYKNIKYWPGFFPTTVLFLGFLKFAFVNIDVDIYRSAKDCLDFFWPRLVKGGIFFIQDDYGFCRCQGVTKVIREFILDKTLTLHRNGSEAWIIK